VTTNKSTSLPLLILKTKAYYNRLHQLIDQLRDHPHRDEVIKLMLEQANDDTYVIDSAYGYTS